MRKNIHIQGIIFFVLMTVTLGVRAQTVTLTFTGRDAGYHYVRLNKVVINNLTKNWQEIIWWPDTVLTMQNGTGIDDYAENGGFALSQNNPNPFSGTTDVTLTIAEEGMVALKIADMNGRAIVEMQNFTSLQPGIHQFRISLSTVGTYVMTARQNGKTSSIKMICNGGWGANAIDYLGEAQSLTYMLKSTTNKPFNYGDLMEYIGYATINGSEIESQRITQAQGTSQTFTLQFPISQQQEPVVTTNPVITYTSTTATLGGNVTSSGAATVTERGVCWSSTSTNPTIYGNHQFAEISGIGSFSVNVTGLSPNATYYVKAYAVNSAGTAYGNTEQFTTPCNTVNVSITGNTTINQGGSTTLTASGASTYHWSNGANTASITVSPTMTTTYTVTGTDNNGCIGTTSITVTVNSVVVPTVTTNAVTTFTSSTATLGGNVTNNGGATVTERGVCWSSTSTNPTINGNHQAATSSGTGSFSVNITELSPNTTYYVKAYAVNSAGTAYGNTTQFTTSCNTVNVSIFGNTTINYGNDGTSTTCYMPSYSYYKYSYTQQIFLTSEMGGAASISSIAFEATTVADPIRNIQIYLMHTTSSSGSSWLNASQAQPVYSGNYTFTTGWNTINFTTPFQYNGSDNLAVIVLDVTGTWNSSNYFSSHTASTNLSRLVYQDDTSYSINTPPSSGWLSSTRNNVIFGTDNTTINQGESTTFTAIGANTYHWNNGANTASITVSPTTTTTYTVTGMDNYGCTGTASITVTVDIPPTVTTNSVTTFTATTATCGGNVTSNGTTITERGICWSSSTTNPTLNDSHKANGSGSGSFSFIISGLEANTTYYVKAYATNSGGTVYGSTKSFTTSSFTCGNSTTDYDGNSYNTVLIGQQCWMAENLKTTHLNNGVSIPLVLDSTSWGSPSAAYCYYNLSSYGCLYNYYALEGNQLCPPGWHVPSYDEVHTTLFMALEQTSVGGKMKTTDTTYWLSPNYGATNSSGFSARGGGCRLSYSFSGIKEYATFWISTIYNNYYAYDYYLAYNHDVLDRYGISDYDYAMRKSCGLSVRCLRGDIPPVTIPTVHTYGVYNITSDSATCGGYVSVMGNTVITSKGVCWSTSPNPTISNSHTNDGDGVLGFTSSITGLTAGTTYYVRAYATNSVGTAYGEQESFTSGAPNAPTGVTATNVGTSSSPQIQISWNSVSNATSYKVYRSSSASGTYSQIGSSTSNTYLYDNSPMTGYNYYKVKAVNSAGESDLSSSYGYYYYSATTVPSAPTGVTATNVGTSSSPQIQISWNSVSNATSYKVYRSSSASGTYSQIGSSTSNTYLYDNSPLSGYNYYKVKAVNSAGESSYSSYAYYNNTGGTTAPSAPTGVTATNVGSSSSPQIYITWNSVSNATSYKVYRSSSSGGIYTLLGSATTTSYYDYNPMSGYNYYKVKAVNSAGESDLSSSYDYYYYSATTVPNTPTGVTATVLGNSAYSYVSVSWNPVSDATSYKVYRSSSANGSYSQIGSPSSSTPYYDDYDPLSGYNYYKVKAVNSAGESSYSSYASCYYTPPVQSPCPPTVSVSGTSSQTVSWTPAINSGCGTPTSYKVYHRNPCNGNTYELMTTTTSTSYSVSSSIVHPGINHYIVEAINSSGSSQNYASSSSVSLSAPSTFSVQKLSGGYLKFTWSAVSKATGYQIFISDHPSPNSGYTIMSNGWVTGGNTTTTTIYYPGTSGTTRYFKMKAYYDCGDYWELSNLTSTYKSITF